MQIQIWKKDPDLTIYDTNVEDATVVTVSLRDNTKKLEVIS
jgi:hypothetical protein